jgi:hypothetical protein
MGIDGKAPPVEKEEATVWIGFYPNEIKVKLGGFEKLSPRRIQRSLHMVYKEWNRQRKEHLNKQRITDAKVADAKVVGGGDA